MNVIVRSRTPVYQRVPRTAIGFKPEFLDFKRGIRVGNLEDNQRITRLLKLELEYRYRQPFVTERWGRGVFWIWIGFLPRANREAKPISGNVSFGCSKFFVTVDTEERRFKCGLQIERGYLDAESESSAFLLQPDWDWHRLLKGLRAGSPLSEELERLVRQEGFSVFAGNWEAESQAFSRRNWPGPGALRRLLGRAAGDHWAGFQVYYPMTQRELEATPGPDLIESMLAIFAEVTPLMNLCMQIELPAPVFEGATG